MYLFLLLIISIGAEAQIKLASIFSDNMVLQQETSSKIWGKASVDKNLELRTSWDGKVYKTKVDKNGRFSVDITTPKGSYTTYEISISDGRESVILKDVLIGEVWFCSGQSNMEMPVKGYKGQPVFGSHPYIFNAEPTRGIRFFTIKNDWSKIPKDDVIGTWTKHTSQEVADFSAAAYFFGDLLEKKLQIPIGLIHCAWGASTIEAWMPEETLKKFPEVNLSVLQANEFGWPNGTPTLLYNAMVEPIRGLAVKGVIWYQGEANSGNPALYKKLFPALVQDWRSFFKNDELPVYYAQIAPWMNEHKDNIDWALFRQAQLELMAEVPNTGMIITADAGDEFFSHPPHKIKVGERFAYWALAKTYGLKGFMHSGPIYKSYEKLKDGVVELSFDFGDEGLNPEKQNVEGFEIAGNDGRFVKAQAKIFDATNKVRVWSDEVKEPVEIRYCFKNYALGELKNNAGFPAAPFRVIIK